MMTFGLLFTHILREPRANWIASVSEQEASLTMFILR